MKKLGLLLMTALLLSGEIAKAEWHSRMHRMDDPVKVKIRHIDFYVFPNGEFDFNAHQMRNRRNQNGSYGVRVERDRDGKVRRVGNVYFNYNRYGQVSRMGSVYIKYNHRGLVSSIGRKHLRYRRGGYVITINRYGYGNHSYPSYSWNNTYYYGPANGYSGTNYSYSNSNWNNNNYYDDDSDSDDSDYYYRPSSKKKAKKKQVRGRRK